MRKDFITKLLFSLLFGFLVVAFSNTQNVKAEDLSEDTVTLFEEDMIEQKYVKSDNNIEFTVIDDPKISVKTTRANGYTVKTDTYTQYLSVNSTIVASLTHDIVYYIYDDGKVHIYSSSASHQSYHSNYTTSLYERQFLNTDGSFSYVTCIYEIAEKNSGSWLYAIRFELNHGDVTPTVTAEVV